MAAATIPGRRRFRPLRARPLRRIMHAGDSVMPRDAELEIFDRRELELLTPETAPKC